MKSSWARVIEDKHIHCVMQMASGEKGGAPGWDPAEMSSEAYFSGGKAGLSRSINSRRLMF